MDPYGFYQHDHSSKFDDEEIEGRAKSTHRRFGVDPKITHRGLAEDSQRTRRGLTEDSQRIHRELTEDSQRTQEEHKRKKNSQREAVIPVDHR